MKRNNAAVNAAEMADVTAKEFLTVEEAAQYAGLKRSYLYKLMMSRDIPYYKPRGKMCYFNRSELNEWIRRGRVATNAETERRAQSYCLKRG